MKAMIVFHKDTFVGEIVSWDLEHRGHVIDLAKVSCARLGTHCCSSFILFKDDTHLAVAERGLFGNRLSIRGSITLHVAALSEDIRFDIRDVDDSFIPAEDGQFIHTPKGS